MSITMLDHFAECVRRSDGHAMAVTGADSSLSYAALDAGSNRMANYLAGRGVGPGAKVALSLGRSASTVTAILGVLKSGAAYVPIDPINPDTRTRMILEDARPAIVLTDASTASRSFGSVPRVDISTDRDLAMASVGSPSMRPEPDSVAYVIFTSGTTGRPKGVMVTHANVHSLMSAGEQLFGFGDSDVWTLFHSYGFDFSVWEMWGALGFGGRLVVPATDTARSPDAFYELLAEEGVTALCQTPSAFNGLLDVENRGPVRDLALRLVFFGGEALDPVRLRPWFERHGDERPRIVNMYGITETTVHVTHRWVRTEDSSEHRSPIGVALPHLGIHLLDSSGAEVEDGEEGEIHVSGRGVSLGYLGMPLLTAEKFVAGADGMPMYRSGDLAVRVGGELEYRGRVDEQVQIRGYRVELGEISAMLCEDESVQDAIVVLSDEGQLIGFVVSAGEGPLDDEAQTRLRAGLATRVPPYMLPSLFVRIDKVPLTVSGKVDRHSLPMPSGVGGASAGPTSVDDSTTLGRLAGIWAEALHLGAIEPDTDFYEAGGHSLLAVETLLRARDVFGVEVPLGTLFEVSTLKEVAERIDEMRADQEELVF